MTSPISATRTRADVVLRVSAAALALANGWIHLQLGGLMFTLNAIGFAVLAVALVAPIAPAPQLRFLTSLALAAYAAATAMGWLVLGARYDMGYLSFVLDIVILVLAVTDLLLVNGSPIAIAKNLVRLGRRLVPGAAGA